MCAKNIVVLLFTMMTMILSYNLNIWVWDSRFVFHQKRLVLSKRAKCYNIQSVVAPAVDG